MSPMFDDVPKLYNYNYHTPCIARIMLSCCFAFGVNITNYYVLGKTSPLTYQVRGLTGTL
jgi:solute carrier family 35 protein E3